MKVSTFFSFITFAGLTLAASKKESKTTTTTTKATSTKSIASSPTTTNECIIVKEAFGKLNATYPWFTDIANCCKNKTEFTCTDNKIEAIKLNSVKLQIPLSEKFGELTSLKQLSLANTGILGSIPSSLFKSKNLEIIELNDNKLTGSLAKEIGDLKKLKKLNLKGNSLEGEIPDTLFKIETLEEVNLAGNKLSGEIPELKNELKTCSFSGTSLCTVNKLSCDESLDVCSKGGLSTFAIVGIIIAGAIVLGIIIALAFCRGKKSNEDDNTSKELNMSERKLTSNNSLSSSSSTINVNNEEIPEVEITDKRRTGIFQPLPDIPRDGSNLSEDIFEKKESESFVLLDIPENVKSDFVEDLIDSNPALISPFLQLKDEKSFASKSNNSSCSSSSCCSSCSCSSCSCSSCSSKSSISSKSSHDVKPPVAPVINNNTKPE